MDNLLQTITCRHYLVEDIIINKEIGSGKNGTVYSGILSENNFQKHIILKCFCSINYATKENFIEGLCSELSIYEYFTNVHRISKLLGIAYKEINNDITFYLLMKKYNHIGDLYDYISKKCFWKLLNEQTINEQTINESEKYIYKNDTDYWLYVMSRKNKINMTLEMCKAVEELHTYNIVHGDIKLNNMLYHTHNYKHKEIIIFDFGGSVYLGDNKIKRVQSITGTEGYMPKEMNNFIISKKSDIYSLGITILELWMGKIWEDGETYEECRQEVLQGINRLQQNEPELSKILRRCIDTSLDKRPYIKTLLTKLEVLFNK